MSDSIRTPGTNASFAVGRDHGSAVSTQAPFSDFSVPEQVIKGSSLIIDGSIPQLIKESYNTSFASIPTPGLLESGSNFSVLTPVGKEVTNFISDMASAELSGVLLAMNQVALEEEERLYEQYYSPDAPQPAANNDYVMAQAEADTMAVLNAMDNVSILAFLPQSSPESFSSLSSSEGFSSEAASDDVISSAPLESLGRRTPGAVLTLAIDVRNVNQAFGFFLNSTIGSLDKTRDLLSTMSIRSIQNYIGINSIRFKQSNQQEGKTLSAEESAARLGDRKQILNPNQIGIGQNHNLGLDRNENLGVDFNEIGIGQNKNFGRDWKELPDIIKPGPGPTPEPTPEEDVHVPQDTASQNAYFLEQAKEDNLMKIMQGILSANLASSWRNSSLQARSANHDRVDSLLSTQGESSRASVATFANQVTFGDQTKSVQQAIIEEVLKQSVNTLNGLIEPTITAPLNVR